MRFSVVIATHERPRELAKCLSALGSLDFSKEEFEIIVVNDGGVIAAHCDLQALAPGTRLLVVTQRNAGPGAARNAGALVAGGDVLAFVDDDCIPPPDWLSNLSKAMDRAPDAMVGGHTINALVSNWYSRASQCLVDYVYHFYNTRDSHSNAFFASNNMAISARSFAAIGGFDDSFRTSEDRELCNRWKSNGGRFFYAPDVTMYHAHQLNILSHYRQHFGYGRGALSYWQKTGGGGLSGIRIEPVGYYAGMFRYPFKHGEPRPALVSSLIFYSQLSNAMGFAWEAAVRVFTRRRTQAIERATVPHEPNAYRAPGPL